MYRTLFSSRALLWGGLVEGVETGVDAGDLVGCVCKPS